MVITNINNITSVGHDAKMTAASVRAGIVRFKEFFDYYDIQGNPITVSTIEGFDDNCEKKFFLTEIAEICLYAMIKDYFSNDYTSKRKIYLLLGFSSVKRPGAIFEDESNEIEKRLLHIVKTKFDSVTLSSIKTGNSSVIHCLNLAKDILNNNPEAICIIGGIDSLLSMDTLDWLEDNQRLKSETLGRNQALIPGEAVGFLLLESKQKAKPEKILAEIIGVSIEQEPAPFISSNPSKGEGLTKACQSALSMCENKNIQTVLCDINGEFFRSQEWCFAELRVFEKTDKQRHLLHPAEYMGDIGAASAAVLTGIAAEGLSRGWIKENILVFCSDDFGERGAIILKSGNRITNL